MIQPSEWHWRSLAGKVLIGLALTAIMGGINVAPSYADNDHSRGRRYDNQRYHQGGPGYDRNRHGHGRWHDRNGYRYYADGYRHRIYAAPPVFYAPPPEPGIHVFFPPIYINP